MGKISKNLKKSFPKAHKSAFDFDRAVAEAYEMFPRIEGRVFFIDVNTNALIHPDPLIRNQMSLVINENTTFKEALSSAISEHKQEKSSRCMGLGGMKFILLYLEKDFRGSLGEKHPLELKQYLTFDHELAHAIIPKAFSGRGSIIPESIADSYAAIRHFQRFGVKTDTIETLMQRRAALAFFAQDTEHFTGQALEIAISLKKGTNFKTLTPAETACMAEYMGMNTCIGRKVVKSLSYHFHKCQIQLQTVEDESPLRQFVDMVFSTRSPEMAKWSAIALQAFLDKKAFLATDKRILSLQGPYWKKVRQDLKERRKSFGI